MSMTPATASPPIAAPTMTPTAPALRGCERCSCSRGLGGVGSSRGNLVARSCSIPRCQVGTITAIAALRRSAGLLRRSRRNLRTVYLLFGRGVKQIRFAWDGPRRDCIFDLEVVKGTTLANPDVENNSPRLRVSCGGHRPLVVAFSGGLAAPVGIDRLGGPPPKDNLIPSPYLYMTKRLTGPTWAPALILAGYAFASDPGATKVLALERSGAVSRVVFSRDEFLLESISNLDHDRKPGPIGLSFLSEAPGLWNDLRSVHRVSLCRPLTDPDALFIAVELHLQSRSLRLGRPAAAGGSRCDPAEGAVSETDHTSRFEFALALQMTSGPIP